MNAFDEKLLEHFPGKVVRKDLTALMKTKMQYFVNSKI